MTDSQPLPNRFAALLATLADGNDLPTCDERELLDLLGRHPELVDEYLAQVSMHNLLSWELAGSEPPLVMPSVDSLAQPASGPLPAIARRMASIAPAAWAVAAGLLLAAGLFGWFSLGARATVAVLIDTEDAVWRQPVNPAFGAALARGERLALRSGVARVGLSDGAGFVLEGPCSAVLLSAHRVRLESGNLVAFVPEGAEGFTVTTPAAEIVDLGTRFAASVGDGGATLVRVLEGAVEARPRSSNAEPLRLDADQSLRFDASGQVASAEPLPLELPEPPRLDQLLAYRPGRRPPALRQTVVGASDAPPSGLPAHGLMVCEQFLARPVRRPTADALESWRFSPQHVIWGVRSPALVYHDLDLAGRAVAIRGRGPAEPLLANRLSRRLAQAVDEQVYFSFIFRYDGLDEGDFFVLWFDTTDSIDASHSKAPSVGIKAGRILARLSMAEESYGVAVADGRPLRLVGRLFKHGSDRYNRLAVWIDPPAGSAPQPDLTAQVEGGQLAAFTHLGIRMGQDTEADDRLLLSQLRLGHAWDDVHASGGE